ncbi:MAG: hypothetical protein K8R54_05215 [Bacteroidales bacterium]|nr:hypothetical protein [Bacteroidales bacterium]
MKIFYYLINLILLFLISCDGRELKDENFQIQFINNSKHKILLSCSYNYPDTSLTETTSTGCGNIEPYSTENCQNNISWQNAYSHNEFKILCFFVWDIDTIEKYGADICREEYKILKRYDYSLESLEEMNWIITFP